MIQKIKALLQEEFIDVFGVLPIEEATVMHPSLMPDNAKSILLVGVPYRDGASYHDGISAYAHVSDYHKYFEGLFSRLIPKLEAAFPGKIFRGFADHSPIAEKAAAAKAGLGVIGRHSLLINPLYGSYLFLGEVITDLVLPYEVCAVKECQSCGQCAKACPVGAIGENGIDAKKCLSGLSQKKRLTQEELALLKQHGITWGCDICQEICPYHRTRLVSPIPFFSQHQHGEFSAQEIEKMDEETFNSFAFSWRGRRRICENLYNFEKLHEQEEKTDNFT